MTLPDLPPYQQTLPHVRAHARDGQWFLPLELAAETPPAELAPSPRLRDHDPRQASLPGIPGVLNTRAPWVRGSAAAVPWIELEARLTGLDRHRGRAWTTRDHETLAALRAQTWRASDLGQRRLSVPRWMAADVIVRPTDGAAVNLGRNPRERQIIAWVWAAYEAGAGGLLLTRVDWAAQLHCCPRSVYNYQRALEARGLVRVVQTWVPTPDGVGSQRGPLLLRAGPELVALAGSTPAAQRTSCPPQQRPDALQLLLELDHRARRRLYHVSGQHWRAAAVWRDPNRQTLPVSPPLRGYPTVAPPMGAARDHRNAAPTGAVAPVAAPPVDRAEPQRAAPRPGSTPLSAPTSKGGDGIRPGRGTLAELAAELGAALGFETRGAGR